MSENTVRVLVFSSDATEHHTVITGVGRRTSKNSALIKWSEAATPFGAKELVESHDFALFILDTETQKEGGVFPAQGLKNTMEDVPPIVFLMARQQDDWLASWAGGAAVIPGPFGPLVLQEAIVQLLENAD